MTEAKWSPHGLPRLRPAIRFASRPTCRYRGSPPARICFASRSLAPVRRQPAKSASPFVKPAPASLSTDAIEIRADARDVGGEERGRCGRDELAAEGDGFIAAAGGGRFEPQVVEGVELRGVELHGALPGVD